MSLGHDDSFMCQVRVTMLCGQYASTHISRMVADLRTFYIKNYESYLYLLLSKL
jgi:hypothetical protein